MSMQYEVRSRKINEEATRELAGQEMGGSAEHRVTGFLASFIAGLLGGGMQAKIGAGIAIRTLDDKREFVPMVTICIVNVEDGEHIHAFTTMEARLLVMSICKTIEEVKDNPFSSAFWGIVPALEDCIKVAEERFTTWPEFDATMAVDLAKMQLPPIVQHDADTARMTAEKIMESHATH
jgi:hypothetical protein